MVSVQGHLDLRLLVHSGEFRVWTLEPLSVTKKLTRKTIYYDQDNTFLDCKLVLQQDTS